MLSTLLSSPAWSLWGSPSSVALVRAVFVGCRILRGTSVTLFARPARAEYGVPRPVDNTSPGLPRMGLHSQSWQWKKEGRKEGRIINNCIPKITPGSPIVLYELFKRLSTELSLALFLGMDLEEIESLVDHVIELGKSHWHGFVSVPLKFVPSFLGSGYAQSIDAKTELLKFIHDRIEAGKLKISGSDDFSGFQDIDEAARHVLVFISALIPKAFGSLLTSFCLETAARRDILQKCVDDDSFLDDTLLEVSRLWPPFLGSRRITKQEHAIQGHTIPKGMPVLYITHAANHDPTVFASPDEFIPQRWAEDNRNDRDRVFTLGSGGRECIGKVLAQLLFKECARSLAEHWTWELPDGQSLQYKWLPVSRPSTDVVALFTPR
ncbi:cytochrome P450 26A1-like isoform X2 [Sycon ciliatum]|uniref:cytochrome P450 26A1-like isoform X2 n=1 Tax=Sycon ciliatum TaxID=27933 RepID=UPI0031F671D2